MTTAPKTIFVSAPAKINLFLHVGDKRTDGYHDLESIAVFTFHDDGVWLESADRFSLSISGPYAVGLSNGDDNLALRAARALADGTGRRDGVRVSLQKMIPIASGIGGGSADAAAVLRGLVRLWDLDISARDLSDVARSVGADVPACLVSEALIMQGLGERITKLTPFPEFWLLLVNPGVPVSTAEVFRHLETRRGTGLQFPAGFGDLRSLCDFLRTTANDLEAPARAIAPVIADVLDELNAADGVLLARMSGSGATCFAMFSDPEKAKPLFKDLNARHPDWWIILTSLMRPGESKPSR